MKRKILLLAAFVIMLTSITSCSKSKPIQPTTPVNAYISLTASISLDSYYRFNSHFTEERKDSISKEEFQELRSISTGSASLGLYEVITYTNGEMLLVRFAPEKIDGKYKVEEVIRVPEEMRDLFKHK